MILDDLQAEEYAKTHLQSSGIADELKKANIFIWTIRASQSGLSIAVDISKNKNADMNTIAKIIQDFLAPLNREIDVQEIPMDGNCCYGVCHGCLNGNPELQKTWIL